MARVGINAHKYALYFYWKEVTIYQLKKGIP